MLWYFQYQLKQVYLNQRPNTLSVILKVDNVSKQYRLGLVGTGTLTHDFNRFWHRIRGKEDPYLKIGEVNDRAAKATQNYVWALNDINFEVQKGEVLGIIGKNGAGKSTLLKILSRVTSPTTGSIKTKGRIASLLEVGTGFHPELTGRENIYLNGAILGMSKAEIKSKEEEIIDFSGCQMYIDTPVKRYSSGMRVRLAFAVAAHLEPDILVIDEVLAVGDAEFQKKAIGKMQDISKGEGRTVLFVSHNMAAVKSLCTRGIVLENGLSVFEGSAHEAVNFYFSNNLNIENVDVATRIDRTGNGKLKVTDVALFNDAMEPVSEVISGESLYVKVSVTSFDAIDYSKLTMAINFRDNFENNTLSFITDEMGVNFAALEQQHYFMLKIPKLLLRGEAYRLRIMMFEGAAADENLLDKIDNIMTIHVLPGDIWTSGSVNRKMHAGIAPASIEFQ